jgi:DNA-directed RNA polymerase III subunit RPC3
MASQDAKEKKLREQKEQEKYATEAIASHSREKIQLCHEIVLDHFGSVAARVAAVLLQRGRLTLRELTRFLNTSTVHASTGLMQDQEEDLNKQGDEIAGPSNSASTSSAPLKSQRLIQQALLTLIQHNICWHACVLPDGLLAAPDADDASRGIEYFQIKVEEILPRVRIGAYLAIAEEKFGDEVRKRVKIPYIKCDANETLPFRRHTRSSMSY